MIDGNAQNRFMSFFENFSMPLARVRRWTSSHVLLNLLAYPGLSQSSSPQLGMLPEGTTRWWYLGTNRQPLWHPPYSYTGICLPTLSYIDIWATHIGLGLRSSAARYSLLSLPKNPHVVPWHLSTPPPQLLPLLLLGRTGLPVLVIIFRSSHHTYTYTYTNGTGRGAENRARGGKIKAPAGAGLVLVFGVFVALHVAQQRHVFDLNHLSR